MEVCPSRLSILMLYGALCFEGSYVELIPATPTIGSFTSSLKLMIYDEPWRDLWCKLDGEGAASWSYSLSYRFGMRFGWSLTGVTVFVRPNLGLT